MHGSLYAFLLLAGQLRSRLVNLANKENGTCRQRDMRRSLIIVKHNWNKPPHYVYVGSVLSSEVEEPKGSTCWVMSDEKEERSVHSNPRRRGASQQNGS